MRKSRRFAGVRMFALAIGMVALTAASGRADAIISYDTSGSIDSTGVSGSGVISFIPITGNSFNSPSGFSLGEFQVAALPGSQSTTYTNTPFHITFLVSSVDGKTPDPNETPIKVSGVLNGTVTGGNQSSVVATFDPISNPTFLTGDFTNTLSVPNNPLSLVPNSTLGGQTSAQANLDTTPVNPVPPIPEPTSVAMFLTTLAGLGVRRHFKNRKAA
ncbi:PEP-CTERM sorting domain-containing protein [Singulisphaera sp. PoT]|uniref:PEP-CTERM sorting domain-containing protein n=1 Tax=Singulisphaera sp. PoT TaxID=3411797 RepID=UPI003BF5738E